MKLSTFYHTVKHLRLIQIRYQVWYRFKSKFFKKKRYANIFGKGNLLKWHDHIWNRTSYTNGNFNFLNMEHSFVENINWNHSSFGKLWTYNINYFDFLNQKNISLEEGLKLINDFISQYDDLQDGLEPYPTSLRIINWIKFNHRTKYSNKKIDAIIGEDVYRLSKNLEYHLLANHLLENAFALFFAAYYFENNNLYSKAKSLLVSELKEQILEDGAHYELSVMYHQLMLYRVLDCLYLVRTSLWKNDDTDQFLEMTASKMAGWLSEMTFSNGNIPLFNDAAKNITPTSNDLFAYCNFLGIDKIKVTLSDSGYRRMGIGNLECICDIGNVTPSYQPSHTHADTFNFVLYVDQDPIIVDTGTSTYEKNEIRHLERSTSAHNTVEINNSNSSEVWNGFRVGRRANVVSIVDKNNFLSATHDGYHFYDISHKRTWSLSKGRLNINDEIGKGNKGVFHLHFHNSVVVKQISESEFQADNCKIIFPEGIEIQKDEFLLTKGWNKKVSSVKLKVFFKDSLETKIILIES